MNEDADLVRQAIALAIYPGNHPRRHEYADRLEALATKLDTHVLVPREATGQMKRAWERCTLRPYDSVAADVYRAMLQAQEESKEADDDNA